MSDDKEPMPDLTESSDDDGKSKDGDHCSESSDDEEDSVKEKDSDDTEEIYNSEDSQSQHEEERDPMKLKAEGNEAFNAGDYTEAIQKYKDALNTGKCPLDDKVKCWR